MKSSTGARYWDEIAALSRDSRRQDLWRAHSDAVNIDLLARHMPEAKTSRILKTDLFDEALAPGLYPLLSARSRSVVGVDVSASTLLAAGAQYAALRTAQADVRSLPFATATFDVVVSNSTLDHFASAADISTALAELQRILRPGGQLLLTLDNLANPVIALRNALPFHLLNRTGIVPYGIGATCGPRRLQRLLRLAGFEVLEVEAILHCPRVLAVAAARMVERHGSRRAQQRFLELLVPFERLARWPTRYLTGYFVAVVAQKP